MYFTKNVHNNSEGLDYGRKISVLKKQKRSEEMNISFISILCFAIYLFRSFLYMEASVVKEEKFFAQFFPFHILTQRRERRNIEKTAVVKSILKKKFFSIPFISPARSLTTLELSRDREQWVDRGGSEGRVVRQRQKLFITKIIFLRANEKC